MQLAYLMTRLLLRRFFHLALTTLKLVIGYENLLLIISVRNWGDFRS